MDKVLSCGIEVSARELVVAWAEEKQGVHLHLILGKCAAVPSLRIKLRS